MATIHANPNESHECNYNKSIFKYSIILKSGNNIIITECLQYFIDQNEEYSISNIQNESIPWISSNRPVFDLGFQSHPIWIRTNIQNLSPVNKFYFLLPFNRLNYVDFYIIKNNKTEKISMGSERIFPEDRLVSFPYLELDLVHSEKVDLFIQINTDTHIGLPIQIMGELEFGKFVSSRESANLFFLCITIVYILYQLIFNIYLSWKLRVFLVLSLFFGFFYPFALINEGFRILLPETPAFRRELVYLSVNLFGIFFSLYIKDFLKFYVLEEKYAAVGNLITIVLILCIPISFTEISNLYITNIYIIVLLTMYSYMIFGIAMNIRYKRYWVVIFGSGWVVVYIFLILQYLMYNRVIPFNTILYSGFHIGFMIEFILIGFASYYRHLSSQKERSNLLSKLKELEVENNIINNNGVQEIPSTIESAIPNQQELIDGKNVNYSLSYNKRTSKIDIHQIMKDIIYLLENEKPYLDEKFSIYNLANSLGLRTDQLSAVINKELQTNFWNLITEYRIAEAKKLIQKNPNTNLLRVAYDSGFGSRSAFNRAFQSLEEMSPSEYAKTLLLKV
ncbi:7TM-DISM domain-containing protein [Leptospira sp. GIMC2001]|uniref:7TM-DISM domain-containing protein n=1 Tax=Leptospira sp. GIMC2001 TaxID=1513297 RepID=UPI00234A43ED|nr:helix-turn-helix domain-containing protein [Leptospira sp. GIMC2001]WCL47729.1 helix-turn-helix domain-containing protein [Leptospira sp. GIMC2001]